MFKYSEITFDVTSIFHKTWHKKMYSLQNLTQSLKEFQQSFVLSHTFGGVYLALCCACCLEDNWPARVQPPKSGCSCPVAWMCSPKETAPKLFLFLLLHFYREESCRMTFFYQLEVLDTLVITKANSNSNFRHLCLKLEFITLVDKLHDCCHLLLLGLLGLGSPCWTASQRKQCDTGLGWPIFFKSL